MEKKKARAMGESYGFLLIVGAILVLLNVLGAFAIASRLDLTEKRLFSLSDGSKRLASHLTDRMEITAYFTADLPPPFNATERYVRDILSEYENSSNGKIRVNYVNPDTDEKREEADHAGVRKVSHQVIENDSINVREGYRGLAFRYLGDTKQIPVVEDTSGLEYAISQIIKEMVGSKTKVGLLSGHEGPSLAKGLSALRDALPTYELQEVQATSELSRDLRALLIVSPGNEIPDPELQNINQFVMRGGSLGVFGGTMNIDPEGQDMTANHVNSGVNRLLERWGIRIESNIVADAQCGRAPMQTPLGFPILVPYPPVPIVTFDDHQREHPALFRLDQVIMPFTSSLTMTNAVRNDRRVKRSVLGRSSENAWPLRGESVSVRPRNPREWDFEEQPRRMNVIAAVEGRLPSAYAGAMSSNESGDSPQVDAPARATKDVRVLVSGSSGFMRDEFLPRPDRGGQRDLTSALAFALNAIDWLAQESDLIAIRAKNVEDPALEVPSSVKEAEDEIRAAGQEGEEAVDSVRQGGDEGEAREKIGKAKQRQEEALERRKAATAKWEAKKATYRWLNTFLPAVVIAGFGLVRWRMRNAKKANLKL